MALSLHVSPDTAFLKVFDSPILTVWVAVYSGVRISLTLMQNSHPRQLMRLNECEDVSSGSSERYSLTSVFLYTYSGVKADSIS